MVKKILVVMAVVAAAVGIQAADEFKGVEERPNYDSDLRTVREAIIMARARAYMAVQDTRYYSGDAEKMKKLQEAVAWSQILKNLEQAQAARAAREEREKKTAEK